MIQQAIAGPVGRQGPELVQTPPSPPCVPPELLSALADRQFVTDGSPAWTPNRALTVLSLRGGLVEDLRPILDDLVLSATPVPTEWIGDRLSVMWGMFMASRSSVDPDAATIWLGEHMRLLGDLPHDIVASAIDKAICTSKHGFLPSVGEIRQHADSLADDRRRMIERLEQMVNATAAMQPV